MHVVWFKKGGEWHWLEIFNADTVDIVKAALTKAGYEVSKSSFDPRKYSLVNQGAK